MQAHAHRGQRYIIPETLESRFNMSLGCQVRAFIYILLNRIAYGFFLPLFYNGIFKTCRSIHYKTITSHSIFIKRQMLFL